MLRAIRHRLQMIRYYSAAPQRTVWTAAMDAALIVSLLLAWPASFLAELAVSRRSVAADVQVQLYRESNGDINGRVVFPEDPMDTSTTRVRHALALITVERDSRGWPIASFIIDQPARVSLMQLAGPPPAVGETRATDSPIGAAIREALFAAGQGHVLVALARSEPLTHRRWLAWAANACLLWILLAFAATLLVQAAQIVVAFASAHRSLRRSVRRSQNLCVGCGYDLRGLDFNERCPECGSAIT